MRNFGDEICIAMASSRDTPTGYLSGRLTVWKKIQITSPFAIIVFATEVSLRLALSHERFASALDHVTCVFATHHQCTYPSSLVRTSISNFQQPTSPTHLRITPNPSPITHHNHASHHLNRPSRGFSPHFHLHPPHLSPRLHHQPLRPPSPLLPRKGPRPLLFSTQRRFHVQNRQLRRHWPCGRPSLRRRHEAADQS